MFKYTPLQQLFCSKMVQNPLLIVNILVEVANFNGKD